MYVVRYICVWSINDHLYEYGYLYMCIHYKVYDYNVSFKNIFVKSDLPLLRCGIISDSTSGSLDGLAPLKLANRCLKQQQNLLPQNESLQQKTEGITLDFCDGFRNGAFRGKNLLCEHALSLFFRFLCPSCLATTWIHVSVTTISFIKLHVGRF